MTIALVYVSRRALRSPASHGFPRFLAWEAILVLVLVNFVSFREWFRDPYSARQIISWILLVGSLLLGVPGIVFLRVRGRPRPDRADDDTLVGIEKTTRLVTTGVFRYVRHPLYSSLLFLAWGVFFKGPGWVAGLLAACATAMLYATARAEEKEDLRYFGDAYRTYMARSRMFVPFLF
ncbi:MAG: isoprenylcysteine carboxylmethyltransferase family protein [Gemmatimonadota bacterium]